MSGSDEKLEKIKEKKLKEMLQSFKRGSGRMGVRIVIPVLDEGGLDARLSGHFGRAPYFSVIELDETGNISDQRTVPNRSEHFGGRGRPSEQILQLEPGMVITYGMGPRGLRFFQNARVAILRANTNTVQGVISAYNRDELEELTEGCLEARHR